MFRFFCLPYCRFVVAFYKKGEHSCSFQHWTVFFFLLLAWICLSRESPFAFVLPLSILSVYFCCCLMVFFHLTWLLLPESIIFFINLIVSCILRDVTVVCLCNVFVCVLYRRGGTFPCNNSILFFVYCSGAIVVRFAKLWFCLVYWTFFVYSCGDVIRGML